MKVGKSGLGNNKFDVNAPVNFNPNPVGPGPGGPRPSNANQIGNISKQAVEREDANSKPKNTLSEIQRLQREREERRKLADLAKQERAADEQRNRENGTPGDVDFQRMIRAYREQCPAPQPHTSGTDMKINICIRKRPISQKEIARHDYDSLTCLNPQVIVHDCKLKVDGISKYLENTPFEFDHSFHEENTTRELYECCVKQLVKFTLDGGRSTVFAYGQTGSGKTYTMRGIQSAMVDDVFYLVNTGPKYSNLKIFVTYFEIYGGRCQDLLNNREKLNVREDGNGEVIVSDLMEAEADCAANLHSIIELGNANRTTHATASNDVSSRSHAVCQISFKNASTGKVTGKISLIDLAGSERGADTTSHNRQRRMEGAEINKSLLALKECIRALDGGSSHVPYRSSKLTLVLKDSFTRQSARTVMICNVSPAASSADHTLNTLRYADRVKERTVGSQAARNNAIMSNNVPGIIPPQKGEMLKAHLPPKGFVSAAAGHVNAACNDMDDDSYFAAADSEWAQNGGNSLVDELHRTVQDLFEEEEALLNLHMSIIQENAEFLTEEGQLLQKIQQQGVDSDYEPDYDTYAARLDQILEKKQELINVLQTKLKAFRQKLIQEEIASKRLGGHIPQY